MHAAVCAHVQDQHGFYNEEMAEAQAPAHLSFLYDVGKLPSPDEAVVGRDQEETVSAVQGRGSGLHQPGLNMAPAWHKRHGDDTEL